VDERKRKEKKSSKSQPGDGEEHEGLKDEVESGVVDDRYKRIWAMRHLFTLCIVLG